MTPSENNDSILQGVETFPGGKDARFCNIPTETRWGKLVICLAQILFIMPVARCEQAVTYTN